MTDFMDRWWATSSIYVLCAHDWESALFVFESNHTKIDVDKWLKWSHNTCLIADPIDMLNNVCSIENDKFIYIHLFIMRTVDGYNNNNNNNSHISNGVHSVNGKREER